MCEAVAKRQVAMPTWQEANQKRLETEDWCGVPEESEAVILQRFHSKSRRLIIESWNTIRTNIIIKIGIETIKRSAEKGA